MSCIQYGLIPTRDPPHPIQRNAGLPAGRAEGAHQGGRNPSLVYLDYTKLIYFCVFPHIYQTHYIGLDSDRSWHSKPICEMSNPSSC